MNKQRGFTFIECLIALTIIAIIVALGADFLSAQKKDQLIQTEQRHNPSPIRAASTEYALGNTDYRLVYTFHDESKHVSCWMFSGGGISCIPDNQLTEHKD